MYLTLHHLQALTILQHLFHAIPQVLNICILYIALHYLGVTTTILSNWLWSSEILMYLTVFHSQLSDLLLVTIAVPTQLLQYFSVQVDESGAFCKISEYFR